MPRTIEQTLDPLLQDVATQLKMRRREPTLRQIAEEYPGNVHAYLAPDDPHASYAEVRFPYSPDAVQLIKKCRGAHWNPDVRAWIVPARSARQLSESMYALAPRLNARRR